MSCDKYDIYQAGGMTAVEFAEHARRCPSCAEQAALDRRLDEEIEKMRERVPDAVLWKRIEAALVREKAAAVGRHVVPRTARRPFAFFARGLRPVPFAAVAAALALLILGGVYFFKRSPAPPSAGILARQALDRVELKEKEYADAIDALERQVRPRIEAMDLQMASLYRDKLAAIDAQIERCREALATNSANAHIRQYLLAALQDKRETLASVLGS
ncbi:MAG: hypothetical protein JW742_09630 [Candidatus Aminicenantes bacterium]|nr:hypothetical protein [Candidatus Aminicenantes bacterium]